jgi:1,4-dihydroxy-6-naphthoate synthase
MNNIKLILGFSPCPNDTFIFDALVNGHIDTEGFDFEVLLEDVQTLNRWAIKNKLDVSKISYGVLPLIIKNYVVLNSGGALGKGVGPLLITTKQNTNLLSAMHDLTVAIPGENTTAHMLFSYAYPSVAKKRFLVFNEIENAVLSGQADAGVIIHESRFTYQERGLVKLTDLGEFWEKKTDLPIPLGGIVVRRNFAPEVQRKLERLIRKSLKYSCKNYPVISGYVSTHAQEISEDVMRRHIDLYVNGFSLHLGEKGKAAVKKLLEVYCDITTSAFPEDRMFV